MCSIRYIAKLHLRPAPDAFDCFTHVNLSARGNSVNRIWRNVITPPLAWYCTRRATEQLRTVPGYLAAGTKAAKSSLVLAFLLGVNLWSTKQSPHRLLKSQIHLWAFSAFWLFLLALGFYQNCPTQIMIPAV